MSRARRRDRRVYLRSHPVLFGLLAATRHRPVRRLGRTVLVHGREAYLEALTRVPLDRAAAGTTGGTARRLAEAGLLFDQDGTGHRHARRALGDGLGAAGVDRLRPVWSAVLDRRLAPLAAGEPLDLVPVVAELAGATTAALLGVAVDPVALARAARRAAATAAREELPGPPRPGARRASRAAAAELSALLTASGGTGLLSAPGGSGLLTASGGTGWPGRVAAVARPGGAVGAMLAVAAVNTTVAAIPRAVAWCADDRLWDAATAPTRDALVAELLRVVAPSPLLPRVAAGPGRAGGCPVRAGDRLVLVARHAAGAHSADPDCADPAPARVAQLVFGAGPHACPGARLARAQLADVLAALAPYRPAVVRARADRRAALPGWASLVLRPTAGHREAAR
ncbi:cytochrome P450 [Micromonospora sp. NPDC049559]|uniref:cytochrome P450 n=1 Tax=Micromonospora sp. NPDC049559 TaxID=3155923 RepID=UPI0034284D02